jgi:hypothetical protein
MEEINRRNFIQKGGKLTLAAGVMTLPAGIADAPGPLGKLFVHHVFFWLKEPASEQQVIRFENALKELVTIQSIHQFHLGKPADTRREVIDSSYQYSLLTLFADKATHDNYQVHPVHDAFRKVADELCSKVVVFDSVTLE